MGTIVRRNERSWAIVIISEIRTMLKGLNLKIKSAGGESTLSVNKKSMFPDVLLYEDEAQNRILQGWELKMPDVLITDEALIKDAIRKAIALDLNSFVIWNFTYGKLYIRNANGDFEEAKVWSGTNHIKSREDVTTYKAEWLPIIKDIVLTVNEFLMKGTISASSIETTISDGLMTEIIQRNKDLVAENLILEVGSNMTMESRLKVWWNVFHEEYDKDESDMYSAYAKSILLNWTNRIMFANTIKKYHNCAYIINRIDSTSTPSDGNAIIDEIVEQGDFYNVFKKLEYNEIVPEDTWIDIVDYNQFLVENEIEKIDQAVLQEILEKTVNTAKREIRGQYATPYCLADLLCQITIHNWNDECADLCAGTGTIARAIIKNKTERLRDSEVAFTTTWIADKYAYPLQIANIAVTNMEALNIPLNIFQSDVFAIKSKDKIEIKSPIDGSGIEREVPNFGAIVSNLPFVEYNKIATDEIEYISEHRQQIKDNTGIEFTLGKTDLYNYLPFKLYELLEDGGKLGIILSNSWLGTDIGKKFFDALLYYYDIRAVVISNCGRWFKNADVVVTLLILQKKEIRIPNQDAKINFWMLNKDIEQVNRNEKETIVNSIVLEEEIDSTVASVKNYSIGMIRKITDKGITLNALFHNVSWVNELAECLIPIEEILTVKRGERRGWNDLFYPSENSGIESEYIKPVLKNPALLKSYTAQTDIVAFCCHKSKDELHQLGHIGALNWIEKFENIRNGTGKPLPEALKRSGSFWYEMDDATKADFVTALNPDRRLFVSKFNESTFVDQRFTRMLIKNTNISKDLLHALLNSLFGMFAIEAIGFGRGLGVLDASSTKLKNMYMINPQIISSKDALEIVDLFDKIKNRNVMDTEDELKDADREIFDRKILKAIGHEELYEAIKESLLSMQYTRHTVK
ncbi:MAG: N-6 DNA methylase [Ruminococcus flavefaciens]|nr:N-6 DNA methylase [Ruminococcus flavefaciens]